MAAPIFSLVIITPEHTVNQEISILKKIISDTHSRIHLRKPSYDEAEYRRYLKNFDPQELNRIVIHEHHSLAKEFPTLAGIHWKEQERVGMGKADKRTGLVSTSFHTLEDLKKEAAPFEYVFLSPVFDSVSKNGHTSAFNLDELKPELQRLHEAHPSLKVMALGGITEHNIKSVKEAGFDGAAVLGSIWQAEDPVEAHQRLLSRL